MEKRLKRVSAIGVAYLSLGGGGGGGGDLCFILEFLLDLRKDNVVILVIRSFFPYQGLVLPY